MMLRVALLAIALAATAPGVASACRPGPYRTMEEKVAAERLNQERLWAEFAHVFTAVVVNVEQEPPSWPAEPGRPPAYAPPGQQYIRVQLTPELVIKGEAELPGPYDLRNVFYGCVPSDLATARVGHIFLVYGDERNLVRSDRLTDPVTLAAWAIAQER